VTWNTQNIAELARSPGRLTWNPTDLSAAYPYGGTDLGRTINKSFQVGRRQRRITAEEYGGELAGAIITGTSGVLAAMSVGYQDNAWDLVFDSTTGASSGKPVYDPSGQAGTRVQGGVLLFVPDDVANHRALILYNAIPLVEESAQLALRVRDRVALAMVFEAARVSDTDSANDNKSWGLGLIEDLSL